MLSSNHSVESVWNDDLLEMRPIQPSSKMQNDGSVRWKPLDSQLKCNCKVFEERLGGRSIAEAFSGC